MTETNYVEYGWDYMQNQMMQENILKGLALKADC